MSAARSAVRAERARTNYARMMQANGSPGWSRQRRNGVVHGAGLMIGLGFLVAGGVALLDRAWRPGFAYSTIGVLVLTLAWPLKRKVLPVERVVHEGGAALAVPMRAIPLRLALALTVVGLAVVAGGVLSGLDDLRGGDLSGVLPLVFGLVVGIVIAGLGAVNLAGPARRPKPLLVDAQGVTWWLARLPQLVRWDDITSIDEWSRPIGIGLFNPRANYLAIRTREGATPGWVDNRLLAAEPAEVRDLLQHYLDDPADRATLSRTT